MIMQEEHEKQRIHVEYVQGENGFKKLEGQSFMYENNFPLLGSKMFIKIMLLLIKHRELHGHTDLNTSQNILFYLCEIKN